MITRKAYLAGDATFAEYYGDLIAAAKLRWPGGTPLEDVRAALAKGDEHLNSIPLAQWGSVGARINSRHLGALMRERGDYPTLAGLVCLAKELARHAAEKSEN